MASTSNDPGEQRRRNERRRRTGSVNHCVYRNPVTGKTERLQSLGRSNRYYLISDLNGGGASGTIYLCFDKVTGQEVCVKSQRLINARNPREHGNIPHHEAAVMEYCKKRAATSDHPGAKHIVEILDSYQDEELKTHYIVTPYAARGDAFSFTQDLARTTSFYLSLARGFIRDILVGVQFLHSIGVYHRDLKLENFLVFWDAEARREVFKICDFGFATLGHPAEKRTKTMGSLYYCAPELLVPQYFEDAHLPSATDVWAAMTCVFCLVHDCFPYIDITANVKEGQEKKLIMELSNNMISALKTGPTANGKRYLPIFRDDRKEWMAFFVQVFRHPDERPSINEIVEMDWAHDIILEDEKRRVYHQCSGMLDFSGTFSLAFQMSPTPIDLADENKSSSRIAIPEPTNRHPSTEAASSRDQCNGDVLQGSFSSRPIRGSPSAKESRVARKDIHDIIKEIEATEPARGKLFNIGRRLRMFSLGNKKPTTAEPIAK